MARLTAIPSHSKGQEVWITRLSIALFRVAQFFWVGLWAPRQLQKMGEKKIAFSCVYKKEVCAAPQITLGRMHV